MQKTVFYFLILLFISLSAQAEPDFQNLTGTWISKGQMETRTLSFSDNGKGEFLSEHGQKRCLATLDAVIDGQFIMAAGVAKNCQQKNNAVSFEFYCQQTEKNKLRCNIRSKHQKSGNTKQGAEDFQRL